jgi:hypothetical protein
MSVPATSSHPHTWPWLPFLLLLLACTPFNRLAELNRSGQAVATGIAVINQGDFRVLSAYSKLQELPGYRLETQLLLRDQANSAVTITAIRTHDARGNSHTITQQPHQTPLESYFVDGQTYRFNPTYNGWVISTGADAEQSALAEQIMQFPRWLAQFGAVPVAAGPEVVEGRAATRYTLQYLTTKLAAAAGRPTEAATPRLEGTLWVDDETGALIKAEILLFDSSDSRQPNQEFLLTVNDIGQVAVIAAPSPLIDIEGQVAATATAQAWSVLKITLTYQQQPISFDLIPLEVTPSSPGPARLKLSLRSLPGYILDSPDDFLVQFQKQLTLSLPQNNTTAVSSGYVVDTIDASRGSIEVRYQFEANLENSEHAELIIAGAGNPIFAPVPVNRP